MNIYTLPGIMKAGSEYFEALLPDQGILIERIISTGQTTPPGVWLEQDRDEWVLLLQGQARLVWKDGQLQSMQPGDWIYIPAGAAHRVEFTSTAPPCIWLAVHGAIG